MEILFPVLVVASVIGLSLFFNHRQERRFRALGDVPRPSGASRNLNEPLFGTIVEVMPPAHRRTVDTFGPVSAPTVMFCLVAAKPCSNTERCLSHGCLLASEGTESNHG